VGVKRVVCIRWFDLCIGCVYNPLNFVFYKMPFVDTSSISQFWGELIKFKFTDYDIDSRIPGGTFFIHSVRSPLTALQINLDELEKAALCNDVKKALSIVKDVKVASQQISHLVNDIPNSNKLSNKDKVNVYEVLNCLKTLYKKDDKSCRLFFNIKLNNKKEAVKLNRLYFFELMSCLISNGFESYDKRNKNKIVIVTVIVQKKQLKIQVQDFGHGVNALQAVLMTQNYYTTKKMGHGFGLWFVKEVVEKHFKRRLKIISEVNQGTIVRFSLPIA
jgi:signal transduction histidine kinase